MKNIFDIGKPKQKFLSCGNSYFYLVDTEGVLRIFRLFKTLEKVFSCFSLQIGKDEWHSVSSRWGDHVLALKIDGTLWGWGMNVLGQLGVPGTYWRKSPVRIGEDDDWKSISDGCEYSIALKTDGTLWAWGSNPYFHFSSSDEELVFNTNVSKPLQIGKDNDWSSVSSGKRHSLLLKADGTLWAWGLNQNGQLGLGDGINRLSPSRVGTDNDWSYICSGGWHSLALKNDGTLWAWGYNGYGQLGIGVRIDVPSPTKVNNDTDWVLAYGSGCHSLALKNDGTLWSWGLNDKGQLGLGDTINRSTPTQVGVDNDWVSASGSRDYSIAIKADGTLWIWGESPTFLSLNDSSSIILYPTKI